MLKPTSRSKFGMTLADVEAFFGVCQKTIWLWRQKLDFPEPMYVTRRVLYFCPFQVESWARRRGLGVRPEAYYNR